MPYTGLTGAGVLLLIFKELFKGFHFSLNNNDLLSSF